MSYSNTIIRTYRNSGGTTVGTETQTVTSGSEVNVSEAVAGAGTTVLVVGVDVSACKSFMMTCDVACTVGMNDAYSGTPDGKFTLAANRVLIWTSVDPQNDGTGQDCPLTADVTEIHVTVAGATGGTFVFTALVDPTPA